MTQAETALASDRATTRHHGLQANRAFVVESLLLLLFLSLALALILRMFAAADTNARAAHAKATELHLAGNAAEIFAANPLQDAGATYFDTDGNAVEQGSSEAAFQVSLEMDNQPTDAGTMYNAKVVVTPLLPSLGVDAYTLSTTRYVSNTTPSYQETPLEDLNDVGANAVGAEDLAAEGVLTADDAGEDTGGVGTSEDTAAEGEVIEGAGTLGDIDLDGVSDAPADSEGGLA